MKRLLLALCLCVVGFVLAPIASASALTGACTIEGGAELTPALNAELQNAEFTFTSSSGSCKEGLETVEVEEATVEGKGELSCPAGENIAGLKGEVKGEGLIKIRGKKYHFYFSLVAAGGTVTFTVHTKLPTQLEPATEEVNASGEAEFLTDTGSATQCAELEAKNLKFTAAVAGKLG
jgi:hypothetical protein